MDIEVSGRTSLLRKLHAI